MAKKAEIVKQVVESDTFGRIQHSIAMLRGKQVLLDFQLAALYGVETKALNQAVKRNLNRFPEDFMFRLTPQEAAWMRSQFVTTYSQSFGNQQNNNFLASEKRRADALPYDLRYITEEDLDGVMLLIDREARLLSGVTFTPHGKPRNP